MRYVDGYVLAVPKTSSPHGPSDATMMTRECSASLTLVTDVLASSHRCGRQADLSLGQQNVRDGGPEVRRQWDREDAVAELITAPAAQPVAVDRIVATVNGQPIKASELDAHASPRRGDAADGLRCSRKVVLSIRRGQRGK